MQAKLPDINKRVSELIDFYKKGSRKAFAETIGTSPQNLNRYFNLDKRSDIPKYPVISRDIIDLILLAFPEVNTDWLVKGEGSMLKSERSNNGELITKAGVRYKELGNGKFRMTVEYVSQKAYAKYLDEVRDAEEATYDTWDFIVDRIGHGEYKAFEIKGDSMDDDSRRSICNGDVVLARDLSCEHWKSPLKIKDFPYWIIVTDSTVVCKQIIDHDVETGTILCHSLNDSPEYNRDFELKLSEVKKLYNIIQRVTIMM